MMELLRNALLYAPEPRGRSDILVCEGKIAWIGPRAPALPDDYGAIVRDLDGRRVIPGLIDSHVHVTGGGGESGFSSRVPPLPLSRFTRGGTTTLVGLLGTDDVTRSTADLLARARGLAEEGLSTYCFTGGYHLPPATLTGSVRGDIVNVERIIGVGELAVSDHRSSQPELPELLRIAADAHVAGMMTGKAGIVHVHVGDGPRGLELLRAALEMGEIPPRVLHPTHVNRRRELFNEALTLAEKGCTIDLTSFPVADGDDAIPAPDALLRYLGSGLPPDRITVSSDGGGSLPVFDSSGRVISFDVGRPESLGGALTTLLSEGHPPERVVPAFTSNVARLLRLESKGRIAEGADADLVVLDEHGGISDVMAAGRWHLVAGLTVARGSFEETGG